MASYASTWKPHSQSDQQRHGSQKGSQRDELPDEVFAFPDERKEPLTDARHVRTALARFDQVQGVSDAERDRAFANIRKAAEHYGVEVAEKDWRQLGKKPHTPNSAH